ncbi:MAG: hypothetical protein ACXADS_16650 [Candidatus Thorarchaeota archaeon]|jgi:hypothetical protein
MTAAVIKSQDGCVTVYVDSVEVDGDNGVDLCLFVRGNGFQVLLDRRATEELMEALKQCLSE